MSVCAYNNINTQTVPSNKVDGWHVPSVVVCSDLSKV